MLDPDALTIGFARRFATYKRATLLLRDPERLARILNDPTGPVQFIFAGKAHPHDDAGKELIRQIVALSRQEPSSGGGSSSSKTTTWRWRATWCRASTSG